MGISDPIDVYIGQKLRARRTLLGMSQESLGQAVGVTFQQIQKYERGTNRIVVSRLYQFSKVLNVPITYFFDGIERELQGNIHLVQDETEGYEVEPFINKSSVELLKGFATIDDPIKKKLVSDLVRTFAVEGKEAS